MGFLTAFNVEKRENTKIEGGFSLIEVTIVLLVISILMASMLQTYNVYSIQKQENDTKNRISVVQAALSKYLEKYGTYPRPADRNIPIGTALFGKEAAVPTVLCTVSTATSCLATGATVYVGDVPFSTLGIHYKNIVDSFGGKLTYAVSAALTGGAFSDTGGAIRVLANNNTDIFAGATPKAQFFVFSSGPDHQGTYGLSGAMLAPCGAAATNGTDTENCNGDLIFRSNYDTVIANVATYHKYIRYFANGANNFDDLTGYQNTLSSGLWSMAPNMGSLVNSNTGMNVLVGTPIFPLPASCSISSPILGCVVPPQTRMDVQGVARTTELRTKSICKNLGAGCADPVTTLPAGTVAPEHYAATPTTGGAFNATTQGNVGGGILCASNRPLSGFSLNGSTGHVDETCTRTDLVKVSGFAATSCTAGTYAVGINAAGVIVCGP